MYSLLRFRPLVPGGRVRNPAQVGESRPNLALNLPWVQRSTLPQTVAPIPVPAKGSRGMESRELGAAPPVEQREGDRLSTPTLVPPKTIALHEVTVPSLPQIPA